jgi:hypothetical protein
MKVGGSGTAATAGDPPMSSVADEAVESTPDRAT